MANRPWRYDADRGAYRSASGRLVSPYRVRRALDTALKRASQRARILADDLRAGRISRDAWHLEMRTLAKETTLYSEALARGGWAQLDQRAYGHAGARIREQYAYLANFRAEIDRGLPLDGRIIARSELYAQAGRATYHQAEQEARAEQGYTEERSVMDRSAEHCDHCEAEAAAGYQPLGAMTPIGERACRTRCRCHVVYR